MCLAMIVNQYKLTSTRTHHELIVLHRNFCFRIKVERKILAFDTQDGWEEAEERERR